MDNSLKEESAIDDYNNRVIESNHQSIIPKWLQAISYKLYIEGIFTKMPDQVIINEYIPRQGIAQHIDCSSYFGDVIGSLSLGPQCIMNFTNKLSKKSMLLERRSLLVLQGEARYLWKHGITARKSDFYQNNRFSREKRISLTFRTVIK